MLHTKIRELISEAASAQSVRAHTPPGFVEPTAYHKIAPVRALSLLSSDSLSGLFGKDGKLRRTPNATLSGQTIRLDAGVVANSRVAEAGAHVVIVPERTEARATSQTDLVVLQRVPGAFRTVEAAPFQNRDLDTEQELTAQDLPVFVAPIDWTSAAVVTKGFRAEIPYRDRKDVDPDVFAAELVAALVLGIGRAADSTLLAKIVAGAPQPFSIAAAAASGVRWDELRAIVGTAGNGAAVGQDGVLRAAGVPAAISPDTASTVIGAWSRSALAIRDEIGLQLERTSLNGSLTATVWMHCIPLVPQPAKFWTVPAEC